jgi:hypothetical protein
MKTFIYAIRVTKPGGTPKIETGTIHGLTFDEAIEIALDPTSWDSKKVIRELVSVQEVDCG